MKKKTFIVLSSVIFTIVLLVVFFVRMYLIKNDTSGVYEAENTDWIMRSLTYMPEISIVTTLIAIYSRNRIGLTFTVLSGIFIFLSFCSEVFIKVIRLASAGPIPDSCIPWLNLPVLVIAIILFVIKFRIYTLPSNIKIKLKLVNIC